MNAHPFKFLTPIGEQTLTVSNSAVGFTATNAVANVGPSGTPASSSIKASYAFCTVESHPLRWSIKGTPQASTGGHYQATATSFWLVGADQIASFLAIRTGGSDSVLHATFFAG